MFCKVCKDSGLPETMFTSHFVKDKPGPEGVVVCPTLLAQECGYCHEKGHTPKFCPKLKAREDKKKQFSDTKKPFCNVCHNAGLSEETYTSHFVKNKPGPDGVVVCPTLLAQKCRYCHTKGHTPKFCPVLAEKKLREQAHPTTESYRPSQQHQRVSANQAQQMRKAQQCQHQQHPCQHAHNMHPQFMTSDMFPRLAVHQARAQHRALARMEQLHGRNALAVYQEMQEQQLNEEFVSNWAGCCTAYTAEEEAAADAEMEEEAEFQNDMDGYDSSSSTNSSMPSLEDCTWG